MKNIKQFFTYLVVGALIFGLILSCKSNEDPGGNGDKGDSGENYTDTVPTATGDAATDLTDATYRGNIDIVSYETSTTDIITPLEANIRIINNKLTCQIFYSNFENVQVLKSGNEYSVNDEYISVEGNAKGYIKFTISTDGNSMEIEYIEAGSGFENFKVVYKGTLNKL